MAIYNDCPLIVLNASIAFNEDIDRVTAKQKEGRDKLCSSLPSKKQDQFKIGQCNGCWLEC